MISSLLTLECYGIERDKIDSEDSVGRFLISLSNKVGIKKINKLDTHQKETTANRIEKTYLS